MTPNAIRNKVLRRCLSEPGLEAASQAAWKAIYRKHRKRPREEIDAARLAMLKVLAGKGSVADAEKAALERLA